MQTQLAKDVTLINLNRLSFNQLSLASSLQLTNSNPLRVNTVLSLLVSGAGI